MRGPLFSSIGLHVVFIVALILASQPGRIKDKPLPTATTVKLVRPSAPQAAPKRTEPKEQEVLPEKKAPPLEVPKKQKDKVLPKLEKPEPDEPAPRAVQPKLERQSDAGTLTLQNPGFEYDFYLAVVQSKIEQNFRPPPGAKAQHMSTVSFVIQSDGKITNIELIKGSGNLLLDQAAERAVRFAGKFPPLPPQYEKGELGINFEFVVNPKAGR
ncbi:TonB family protein [candidate division KSB1 bacterium]|nr:TonB family protein [candidate division KSB1 bacterium]